LKRAAGVDAQVCCAEQADTAR